MNLLIGCLLSLLLVPQILLHILLLVNWSSCSYFDVFYRSMLPKQWSSTSSASSSFPSSSSRSNPNRYLSLRSRPINFANPRQSNKFHGNKLFFAPNDDSHHSRLLFGIGERQSSSILDQQSLHLEQPYDQRPKPPGNSPSGQLPANQPSEQPAGGCNCNPIIKTKYIAIEIPKVYSVQGETNVPAPPPTTEAPTTTTSAPPPPPTYGSNSDAGYAGKEKRNDGSISGKTRIITIREIPNSISKTLLVNSYEGHMYETSSRSSVASSVERERETEKSAPPPPPPSYQSNAREPATRPSKVQQYVGFEDY